MPLIASPSPAQTDAAPSTAIKLVSISQGTSARYRNLVLLPLALAFALATVVYSAAWMYYIRQQVRVELGFDLQLDSSGITNEVRDVWPGGPAEEAGLKPHDRLIALDGKKLVLPNPVLLAWRYGHPGDALDLTVERPGVARPFVIRAIFRAATPMSSTARVVAGEILSSYPLFFLIVGLTVLFVRLDDRNAWLLALLFAGFIAASNLPPSVEMTLRGFPRAFMMGYRALFGGTITPLFYFFFAVFPAPSAIERRVRWLKWALLGLGLSFAIAGLKVGQSMPWPILNQILGADLARDLVLGFIYSTIGLGFASLASNVMAAPSPEARRKLRIVMWGALVGVTPIAVERAFVDFSQIAPPFWLDFTCVVILWIFPVSFAYAVVKHRVLEIPVLLKRSVRYLLVRRGLAVFVVLLAASLVALFSVVVSLFFPIGPKGAMAIGVVFGIALTSASTPGLRRVTQQIDRAFFRGAYDARVILQELAQRAPRSNTRNELATEVARRVDEALHPTWLAIYAEAGPDYLETRSDKVPATLARIRKDSPLLQYLSRAGEPWDAYTDPDSVPAFTEVFPSLRPDCIVVFPARSGEMLGLLVLGSRLSEEPYSGEDKMLLRSVASQAGIALENLRLAEEIAERLEAERHAEHEMEIARQVQHKLFPQATPQMKTLDIAGACTQTRAVGGDYYDFVELGPSHLGLVVADVAGKGISAALLMANLQANLRSQYALALKDLPLLLTRVNHLFYENTESSHYTTMFFGSYDDESRRLTYANCGHCPPLLVRSDGSTLELWSTATVLGLFPDWECETGEVQLAPRDILVLYSDGVTESTNEHEEEFGLGRLREMIAANRSLPLPELLSRLLEEVFRFSSGKQFDDVTVILARAR